ncbi:MAG TPA: hypothetical protein VGL09_22225 [Methylomirabilota bacterium]
MREFGKGQFRLSQAPRALRLIYAGFLALVAIGLLTQLAFQVGRIGVTPAAIAGYYRGSESGTVMTFPKGFWQLLEITHAHAFTMGVVFLVLAHLGAAAPAPRALKTAALMAAFAGTVGDLASPWLVRYVAAGCAWIALASWSAQGLGNLALVVLSGWACLGE